MPSRHEIERDVIGTISRFSAEDPTKAAESRMSELFPDAWDFIELCEDLEQTYGIDLRPFFEEGQPEVGWWVWRQKVARDVTGREVADHVVKMVVGAE